MHAHEVSDITLHYIIIELQLTWEEKKSCVGICRVSDNTVENALKKVKWKWKSTSVNTVKNELHGCRIRQILLYINDTLILPVFHLVYPQDWMLPYHNHCPSVEASEPLIQNSFPLARSIRNEKIQ